MPHLTLAGPPSVTVHLRHSPRARRLSLRVSQLDGRVTLTLPRHAQMAEAVAFAEAKADWIRKHLARRPEDIQVQVGTALPVEGKPREIVAGSGRGIVLADDSLTVSGDAAGRRIRAFLAQVARDRLVAAADHFANRLGRRYAAMALRDTRSRWGSCSDRGRLMFSWRLVMAPPAVLSYVAAHEVAHLAEMHHGPAFWAAVARIHGPYDAERRWLHEHGAELHRYKF